MEFTIYLSMLIVLSMVGIAHSGNITVGVGLDYASIQDAIDVANPGDTIEVHSGIYRENLVINKLLNLQGIDTTGMKPVVDAGEIGSAITLSADGIRLEGFVATNSNLQGDSAGICVISNYNIITGNVVFDNHRGICLQNSTGNSVIDNTASKNKIGIELHYSNNTIKGNSVNNNELFGIYLAGSNCYNNVLMDNTANDNGNGIRLQGCNNNMISKNIMVNNSNYDAYDDGINMWDNGAVGNYYSDFDCSDNNGDGICDGVYHIIPGGVSIDRHPLASPAEISKDGNLEMMNTTGDGKVPPRTSEDYVSDPDAPGLATSNLPPTIESLTPDPQSPLDVGVTVTWRATASDPESDTIYYKFWICGPRTEEEWQVVQDWSQNNVWSWKTGDNDTGSSDIQVGIRDGNHADPSNMDDFQEYYNYQIKPEQLTDLDVEVTNAVYTEEDRRVYYCQEGKYFYVKNRIYLTGSDLNKVKSVKYVLHPTFPNPVQVSDDTRNDFEIWIWTWGRFPVQAIITTKSDQEFEKIYQFSFKSKVEEAISIGIPQIRQCD